MEYITDPLDDDPGDTLAQRWLGSPLGKSTLRRVAENPAAMLARAYRAGYCAVRYSAREAAEAGGDYVDT